MSLQQWRSSAFLIGNLVVSAGYLTYVWLQYSVALSANLENRSLWASTILGFILVQIVSRILVQILVAVVHAASGQKDAVDLEDEMDKTIDQKSTVLVSTTIMIGVLLALGTQAIGWPVSSLFLMVGAGLLAAGFVGDVAMNVFYRRGV